MALFSALFSGLFSLVSYVFRKHILLYDIVVLFFGRPSSAKIAPARLDPSFPQGALQGALHAHCRVAALFAKACVAFEIRLATACDCRVAAYHSKVAVQGALRSTGVNSAGQCSAGSFGLPGIILGG